MRVRVEVDKHLFSLTLTHPHTLITNVCQKIGETLDYDTINDAVAMVMDPGHNNNPSADFRPILPVAAVLTSSYPT